jgi:DNA-directed RNA polymerase subunit RPC12/RpoP
MDRRAIHGIVLLVWLMGFFLMGFGVWGFQAGHLMVIVYLLAGVALYGSAAFVNRCPKCRMPILLRPRKFLGMEFFTWSILTPARCGHCGEPLG